MNSRSMASLLRAALVILLGVVCVAPYEVAAETATSGAKVLFILDASGSMWGRVEGTEKIVVAREVMANLINELPDGTQVGLEAYGHRTKGDCNDIEMMVPVGEGDKNTMIKQINAINPKGKTPITKSFEVASEPLKGVEEETTVVLISDGKETCEGDPCALVRSLREQGINVRVHVVGLDVNQEERDQLVCIAEAGEGKYFHADNAEQLTVALTEVKQELVMPPAPEARTTTKRVIKVGAGSIKVLNVEGFIYVIDPESGKTITNTMKDKPVQLPVGIYKLKLRAAEIDDVEVKAGEEVEIVLD